MKRLSKWLLLFLLLPLGGCVLATKHEIEVKPMHITIDVNVKIQEELKEKFKQADQQSKAISDKEAEEALKKYLESQTQKS